MTPFEDLEQFRALAQTLPDVAFHASGIVHPRISLFAATRSPDDIDALKAALVELPFDQSFTSAVARADADLRLYELDLDHPAMTLTPVDCARAVAFGMMAIEPGPDLFALAALADSSAALDTIRAELKAGTDPLAALAAHGGRDIPALLGALMAARMAELPVIVDGDNALAALLVLRALNPTAISHCAMPESSRTGERIVPTLPCADPRPLYSLASAILTCRQLVIQ